MSASLVGSEMCIRDSSLPVPFGVFHLCDDVTDTPLRDIKHERSAHAFVDSREGIDLPLRRQLIPDL
eukprot:12963282-Alexandrium_andersonii.AAC.1